MHSKRQMQSNEVLEENKLWELCSKMNDLSFCKLVFKALWVFGCKLIDKDYNFMHLKLTVQHNKTKPSEATAHVLYVWVFFFFFFLLLSLLA